MRTTNRHLCDKGESNGVQRRTKVIGNFWQNHDVSTAVGEKDEATLNSEEIKPVAIANIELRLSEGIRQSVSQSVGQSIS